MMGELILRKNGGGIPTRSFLPGYQLFPPVLEIFHSLMIFDLIMKLIKVMKLGEVDMFFLIFILYPLSTSILQSIETYIHMFYML